MPDLLPDLRPDPTTNGRRPARPGKPAAGPLFPPGGPSPDHPKQGGIGDCWLVAGLTAVARVSPHELTRRLREDGDAVVATLAGYDGRDVTDRFSRVFAAGAAADAGRGLWVRAYEKAFAYHRSRLVGLDPADYAVLGYGGFPADVFRAFGLPGLARRRFAPGDDVAGLLAGPLAAGHAVAVGITRTARGVPLKTSHAYSVESAGPGRVVLHNPLAAGGARVAVTPAQLARCAGEVDSAAPPPAPRPVEV